MNPPAAREALAVVVADDLTGAADSAVGFANRGAPTTIGFGTLPAGAGVLAVDTDTRRAEPEVAAAAVRTSLAGAPAGAVPMKKIDSTLRGNVGPETMAMAGALGTGVVLCAPAFPATGRATLEGIQYARGRRIGDVAGVFGASPVARVGLGVVRGAGLAGDLRSAVGAGRVVVIDSETDSDLAAVVAAGLSLPGRVLWVGSGGLAAALATAVMPDARPVDLPGVDGPVLTVVGSGTAEAAAQSGAVRSTGVAEVAFPAGSLLAGAPTLAGMAESVARRLEAGDDVLVTIAGGDEIPPGGGRVVVEELGSALAAARVRPAGMVITGGETARALAGALGAEGLTVAGEVEPGVVAGVLVGGPGCPVVTKAGGFGGPGTLVAATAALRASARRAAGRFSAHQIPGGRTT